eukprot:scaffold38996_cov52-Phaeocystis_antarctica.AAC.1
MSRSTSCSHVPRHIVLLLQTRPRAEKVAGGTSLGCFIGWRRCSREVLTCSGMTGHGRKGAGGASDGRPSGMPPVGRVEALLASMGTP